MSVSGLIDTSFLGANAGLLADAGRLLTEQVLARPEALVGITIDATLAPGGTAIASLVPLLRAGHVDWMAVSGTNLYFDALHALGKTHLRGSLAQDSAYEHSGGEVFIKRCDRQDADHRLREILSGPDFQRPMGSAALHDLLGRHLRAEEKDLGVEFPSLITTAHELGVPVYNPSPADNPLGSLVAGLAEVGNRLSIDTNRDLNQIAAIVNAAGKSPCAIWCLGRGSAANFGLSGPGHLRRILGAHATAAFYEVRLLMAGRAHALPTTPPDQGRELRLSTDLSIAMPLLAAYVLDRATPRPLKRLGGRRDEMLDRLRQDNLESKLKRPPAS